MKFPANSLQVPWSIANRQCLCWSGVPSKKYFCGNFFPAKFRAQGILGAEPPASARSHADGLFCVGVLKTFQVVSWWGIPCRTPRCSGFAVLSAMVLKKEPNTCGPPSAASAHVKVVGANTASSPSNSRDGSSRCGQKLRSASSVIGQRTCEGEISFSDLSQIVPLISTLQKL